MSNEVLMINVVGAEEVLTECSESTSIVELTEQLKKQLKTDVVVTKENDRILVQRLLID